MTTAEGNYETIEILAHAIRRASAYASATPPGRTGRTAWTCAGCQSDYSHPNEATPKICSSCARIIANSAECLASFMLGRHPG